MKKDYPNNVLPDDTASNNYDNDVVMISNPMTLFPNYNNH